MDLKYFLHELTLFIEKVFLSINAGLGFEPQTLVNFKVSAIAALIFLLAFVREPAHLRGRPARYLRVSKYVVCMLGLYLIAAYLTNGFGPHIPVAAFYFALVNMIIANKFTLR